MSSIFYSIKNKFGANELFSSMIPKKKIFLTFCFVFVTISSFSQVTDYDVAKKLLGEGDYKGAIEHYSKYLKKNKDYRAYMGRAKAFILSGDHDDAIKDYDAAIALEPEDSRIFYNRGNCFLEMNEEQAAFADFNQAILLDPANYHAYNSRGYMYLVKDSLDQAEEDFLRSISLNLNYLLAYLNLADLHIQRKDYDIALELIAEYIQHNKEDYEAYTYLGRLYLKMGNFELASRFLGTSLSLKLDQPKVIEEVGEILIFYLKDYPSALEFFGKTNEVYKSSETSYMNGLAHFSQNEYSEALNNFYEVRKLAKDTIYEEVELLIVSCLDELGEDQKVLSLLDSLESVKILPSKVALQKSLFYMEKQDYKQSYKYLESSISKDPDIKSYIQKAYLLSKIGKVKQSLELYEALDTSSLYRTEILESQAQVYYQNNEPDKACACVYRSVLEGNREGVMNLLKNCSSYLNEKEQKVLKILDLMQVYKRKGIPYRDLDDYSYLIEQYPENYDFRLWRGIQLKSKGRFSEAVKDFSKCIELKPSQFEGYYFAGNSMLGVKDTNSYLTTITLGIHKTKAIELYYSRALFYLSIDDYEYAFKDFKELLSIDPTYSNAYYQLGLLFTETREQEKACKYLKQAVLLGHDKARLEFKVSCR